MNEGEGRVFRYGLGIAVAIAWLACVGAEIVSKLKGGTFATPLPVHGLMGTVIGSVFADVARRRRRRENGREEL